MSDQPRATQASIDPDVQVKLDDLAARVALLETHHRNDPPVSPPVVGPPAFTESPDKTLVTTVHDTLAAAVAAHAVITGKNGNQWRLIASTTKGNQIECTAPGGITEIEPTSQHVSTLFNSTDHRIHQMAQADGRWWDSDDVQPGVWTARGATAPDGYVPPAPTVPPEVTPPVQPPTQTAGIKGKQIAGLLAAFGVNLYHNGQGSTGAGVEKNMAALQYLGGGNDADMIGRQYAANAQQQIDFTDALSRTMPNLGWVFCHTYEASMPIIEKVAGAKRKWLKYLEGTNEPNMWPGFYQGKVCTPAMCLSIQKQVHAIAQSVGLPTLLAAVARTSGDPNYIQTYYKETLSEAIKFGDGWNSHIYPNHGCPASEGRKLTEGVGKVFQKPQGMITEFGPKHYQQEFVPDDNTAAYYELLQLLWSHYNYGCIGMQHWPLFDYKGHGPDGLFSSYDNAGNWVGSSVSKPRPAATVIRCLNLLCGDRAANRFSFDPGALDIKVTSLPKGENADAGGHFAVYRASTGVWQVFISDEQDVRGTTVTPITVQFGSRISKVVDYSLTGWAPRGAVERPDPIQTLGPGTGFKIDLRREVRLLQVTP